MIKQMIKHAHNKARKLNAKSITEVFKKFTSALRENSCKKVSVLPLDLKPILSGDI